MENKFEQHCNVILSKKFRCIESDDNDSVGDSLDDCYFAFQDSIHPGKRQRIGEAERDHTAEIVAEMPNRNGKFVPTCASLNLGTTKSIVLHKCMWKGRTKSCEGCTGTETTEKSL